MRILIDTNILIHLEDNKIVDESYYRFYNLAIANNCEVLYHKTCLEDLSRDTDEERKKTIISKLGKYSALKNPAQLTSEFSSIVGEKKINDRMDNIQLLQLHKEYVELFITNDKKLKRKATKLGIDNKVLTSEEAFEFLDKKYTLHIPSHPVLQHGSVREIENDFTSDFFESLKDDYDRTEFIAWIQKCAKQDRSCYHLKIEGKLSALLIYKLESYKENELEGIKDDAFKICTLKVSDDALGMKLGELFLNKMFQMCVHQKVNYLYVTTYNKQEALIILLEKFGFTFHKSFKNNVGLDEHIYLKDLNKANQKTNIGNLIHPFFNDNVEKFVIPIQPQFYKSLFKDGNLRTPSLFDSEDYGLEEIQGNTIVKAYISKATRTDLKPGDLLFFYSSGNYKSIEPVGVLIDYKRISDKEELWNLVRNKTVYSQTYLNNLLDESEYLTVTIFRLVQYLKPVIGFNQIKNLKSYSNKFQTITKLDEQDYTLTIKKSIDESFVIH